MMTQNPTAMKLERHIFQTLKTEETDYRHLENR